MWKHVFLRTIKTSFITKTLLLLSFFFLCCKFFCTVYPYKTVIKYLNSYKFNGNKNTHNYLECLLRGREYFAQIKIHFFVCITMQSLFTHLYATTQVFWTLSLYPLHFINGRHSVCLRNNKRYIKNKIDNNSSIIYR